MKDISISAWLRRRLSVCLRCDWRMAMADGAFCANCARIFWSEVNAGSGRANTLSRSAVRYLATWTGDGDLSGTLAAWIHAQKRWRDPWAYSDLALQFRRRHGEAWLMKKTPIFVPAPPAKLGERDHADSWAEALKFAFGGHVWRCLGRTARKKSQRQGTRSQRAELSLRFLGSRTLKEQVLKPKSRHQLIFCDDVITTGATWQAAQAALELAENRLPCVAVVKRSAPWET